MGRSVLRGCDLALSNMTNFTSNFDTSTYTSTTNTSDFLTSGYVPTYTSTSSSYLPIYTVPYNCVLEPDNQDTFVPTTTTTTTTSEAPMSCIQSEISAWRGSIDELASLLSTFK